MTDTDVGVLLVDDELAVTNLYESWLSEYETYVAHDGTETLSVLERKHDDIDVILLDRKMPGMSGSEVLSEIRDEGFDCRVAMTTAVAPGREIIEMPFDDYVTKPVDREALQQLVADLVARTEYADSLARYYSLVSKHAALTDEHPRSELEESEAFVTLEAEMRKLNERLTDSIDLDSHQEFQYVLRDI